MLDIFSGSPLAAYRADMTGRDEPFGAHDDAWLAAASVLRLASTVTDEGGSRATLLSESIGNARELLGDARIEEIASREWGAERSLVDPLIVLAHVMQQAGALRLAGVLLDDLTFATTELSPVYKGRILSQRARIDWRMGRVDEALDRYHHIASLAKRVKSPELEARAESGLVPIAQIRGNFPEMRAHATRAAALADRHGYTDISRVAHLGVMISATKAKDYDDALVAGGRLWAISRGDPVLEAESLQNIGQLLLETGHLASAQACFAGVVGRAASPRVLLPALSGLALASAHLAHEPTVEWSVREVWRAQQLSVPRYELAAALVECALALRSLGRDAESRRYADAAKALVETDGFHELAFQIAGLEKTKAAPRVTPVELRHDAASVARELEANAPERLPTHVEFETAPA